MEQHAGLCEYLLPGDWLLDVGCWMFSTSPSN